MFEYISTHSLDELKNSYVVLTQNVFEPAMLLTDTFKATLPHVVTNNSFYEDIAKTINQSVNDGKLGVAFYCEGEGFYISFLNIINKVIKILFEKYNFDKNKIFYISSSEPVSQDIELYRQYCKEKDWFFIPNIIYVSWFQYYAGNEINKFNFLTIKNLKPKTKKKSFLFFNGESRPHRLWLIGEIFLRNLQDKFYISMQDNNKVIYNKLDIINNQINQIGNNNRFLKIADILKQNINLFPMTLTHNGVLHIHTPQDLQLYNNSYISLVAETTFFSKITVNNDIEGGNIRSMFLTEKTFKPIKAKHPFIIAGSPYVLERLRKMGYKTFSLFIDESYDTIEDDFLRIEAITNEISRLCNFTKKEWLEFQEFSIPIIEHNFNVLSTKTNAEYHIYHV